MFSQLLLKDRDVWKYYLSTDVLKGQRAVEYPLEWREEWGRKRGPTYYGNETSSVRIKIIRKGRDWSNALSDDASYNTLTTRMGY